VRGSRETRGPGPAKGSTFSLSSQMTKSEKTGGGGGGGGRGEGMETMSEESGGGGVEEDWAVSVSVAGGPVRGFFT
jgi:hypothetical protein